MSLNFLKKINLMIERFNLISRSRENVNFRIFLI